jgi:LPPG:FO 2-phospho-L-lactate transferase
MKARRVVYLSGGVGGARLLDGLARALPAESLTAIVNVGDDFEHLGLYICPDLDTVLYTLSGMADAKRGWGLLDESFRALELARRYGGEDWFQLGDMDLGTHIMRTHLMRQGQSLTQVTQRFARALGVGCNVLPMSDEPLRTLIETAHEGTLSFQDWLVRRRGAPEVAGVRFHGSAHATPEVLAAVDAAELVVIGPSNPYVSIDPILSLPGLQHALVQRIVVAVSPIVGGRAVKGPLAGMIPTLAGRTASAGAVAAHYAPFLTGMVVERGDEASVQRAAVLGTATVMRDADDRLSLARAVIAFADQVSRDA